MPLPSRPAETRPTWTEQFRHECEVRYVLKKSKKWVINHLEKIREKRGEAAWDKLNQAVKIWEKM